MAEDYSERPLPHRDEMLGDIRRALEKESAGPKSATPAKVKAQNSTIDDTGLMAKLDDLEGLLVASAKPQASPAKPPRP